MYPAGSTARMRKEGRREGKEGMPEATLRSVLLVGLEISKQLER